jgi:hypothetical protein
MEEQMNNYLKSKFRQKNNHMNNPDKNQKKYLVIMACHCNSLVKLQTIANNLPYFSFTNCHKIIINSSHTAFTKQLNKICDKDGNTDYYEIKNDKYIDFGKWVYTLTRLVDYNQYDYVILTNDSYIIHSPINHFFNLAAKHNVELFGYNDSSEEKYHYQSYLFILRTDSVQTFIRNVTKPGPIINRSIDVIMNYEVNMTHWFTTHKSFLQIGHSSNNNIFFKNDKLYRPLQKLGLLPFTKLKRLQK